MSDDLYSILGLRVGCTQDDIKQAYHRMAKQYHPDVNRTARAADMMKRINAAYTVLSNRDRRMLYDRQIYDEKVRHGPRIASPTFGITTYRPAQADARGPQDGYAGASGDSVAYAPKKSNARMYVILAAIVLLSTVYLLVLPFVYGSTGTSLIIPNPAMGHPASPTIVTTVQPQPPAQAASAVPAAGYGPSPSPDPNISP